LEIFSTRADIQRYLKAVKSTDKSIGFVPTMGALHQGHLSLIDEAKSKTDVVVCSIFVNPTQFNDTNDLENYPRPVEEDIRKLEAARCEVLFMPGVEEIYHADEHWHIDLDNLDNILEGKIRPGHYQGVTQVVKKMFDIVRPDYAFFGQKDYQQFMIISYMIKKLGLPVKPVICPIVREDDGLAMSSRNIFLSGEDRFHALALFKVLMRTKALFNSHTIEELKREADTFLEASEGVEPEYFEIYNALTFEPLTSKHTDHVIALVAARVGKIRIIDNMILK
jgi:pantoate--beta-alanine ligase